jgi:hypothetical protein
MASRKPVADSLADQIARAQARGRRAATDGSQGYGTRSRSAAGAASSSEDEVFESPRGAEGLSGAAAAGAASLSAQQAAAANPFPRSSLIARTPPTAAAAPPVQRRRQAQRSVDFGATYRLDRPIQRLCGTTCCSVRLRGIARRAAPLSRGRRRRVRQVQVTVRRKQQLRVTAATSVPAASNRSQL